MRTALIVVSLLLSGCIGATGDGAGNEREGAGTRSPIGLQVDVRGELPAVASEPSILQTTTGRILVAGADFTGAQTPMAYSDDGGDTWVAVEIEDVENGAAGNSDTDLALAPDGTVYLVRMSFAPGAPTAMTVARSEDDGMTWTWLPLFEAHYANTRPWIEVAPSGNVHIIWNDGLGVHHRVSADRGESWMDKPDIWSEGGGANFEIDHEGRLAVRVVPIATHYGVDYVNYGTDLSMNPMDGVAISSDGGDTWTYSDIPGERPNWGCDDPDAGACQIWRSWDPLTWDDSGNLFVAWAEGNRLGMARSPDLGETWDAWYTDDAPHRTLNPALDAHGVGIVASEWFSYDEDGGETLGYVTVVRWIGSSPEWNATVTIDQAQMSGEFQNLEWLADGTIGIPQIRAGTPAPTFLSVEEILSE